MAAKMDEKAAGEAGPDMRAEWMRMAADWRGAARQADWQDHHALRLT
jgi:hypothetical protein